MQRVLGDLFNHTQLPVNSPLFIETTITLQYLKRTLGAFDVWGVRPLRFGFGRMPSLPLNLCDVHLKS